MRCCIIGAGSIGGHLAVKLQLGGHDVSVIARGAQLEVIRTQGLGLVQGESTLLASVKAASHGQELGEQDLVFVTTKATALRDIAVHLRSLVGKHTTVVFLQNGMTWWYPIGLPTGLPPLPQLPIFDLADVFLAMMRPEQVLGGIVYSANEVLRPGLIRNNSPQKNVIELAPIQDSSGSAVDVARAVLEAGAIGSPVLANIRQALWLKLVGNASVSSLCVATGNPSAIMQDDRIQSVFLRMLNECLLVAAANGYPVADQMDLSRWTQHRARHKPSMLQDFELGRAMEIHEIVLAPIAFARAAGVDTPTLDAVGAIATRLAQDKGLC